MRQHLSHSPRKTQKAQRLLSELLAAWLTLVLSVVSLSSAWAGPFDSIGSWGGPDRASNNQSSVAASGSGSQFLPVDQAFSLLTQRCNQTERSLLCLEFTVTPGHYLYQDKLQLILDAEPLKPEFVFSTQPQFVDDPLYGQTPVFFQNVTAIVDLEKLKDAQGSGLSEPRVSQLLVRWQGCAQAGLCYPPVTEPVNLQPSTNSLGSADQASSSNQASATSTSGADLDSKIQSVDESGVVGQRLGESAHAITQQKPASQSPTQAESAAVQSSDPFGLSTKPLLGLLLLFLTGLGLAFTPCVLPMLPIVASIVATQHHKTRRGILLTLCYGFGVALAYGVIGALVGYIGHAFLIQSLQNPWVLGGLAILFAVFGLYLLGVITLGSFGQRLFMQASKLSAFGERHLGGYLGSIVAGFLSALVVSPCVSAPLAAALLSIATVGSPSFGFVGLFVLGLGLSLPLVAFGTLESRLLSMGRLTEWIKQGFALSLFAMSLLVLARIISPVWALGLWGVFAVTVAWWLCSHQGKLTRVLAVVALLVGVGWIAGSLSGSQSMFKPWDQFTDSAQTKERKFKTESVELAQEKATDAPAAVLVLSADWCIECRRLESQVLSPWPNPSLEHIELDITQITSIQQEFLKKNQLFGPPALLYYQQGKLQGIDQGWISRADFQKRVTLLLAD